MPSTSCNSNIIALQRQFPNILRKDAEGVTRTINKKGMKRRKSFVRCAPQQLVTEVNTTL